MNAPLPATDSEPNVPDLKPDWLTACPCSGVCQNRFGVHTSTVSREVRRNSVLEGPLRSGAELAANAMTGAPMHASTVSPERGNSTFAGLAWSEVQA